MELISKQIDKENGNFIVLESTKKVYTREEMSNELQNIKLQKEYIIHQSKKLKEEFQVLVKKEEEYKLSIGEVPIGFEELEG